MFTSHKQSAVVAVALSTVLLSCSMDDHREDQRSAKEAFRSRTEGNVKMGAPVIADPVDKPLQDGHVSICINASWPGDCDSASTGGNRAVHIPISGSITVQQPNYMFDAAAIDNLKTGGSEAGFGGDIKLMLTSVALGCDVEDDGFTLVLHDIAKFWDTVTLSADGKTMSWNMTGGNAAVFDDEDCLQIRSPADMKMLIRLPLIDMNGSAVNQFMTLSTIPGEGSLLAPLVITNDKPQASSLDFVFAIDSTGSMWDDIDAVKSSSIELVDTLLTDIPTARIAVIDYKDIPQSPFGEPADYPFRVLTDFSTDRDAIVAAIQGLSAGGGADMPESVYSALMGALQGTQDHLGHSLGAWRDDAEKVILLLGDAPPHDPEPVTGYTLQSVRDAAVLVGVPTSGMLKVENLASGEGGTQGGGVAIYTLQIGNDSTARTMFEALAGGTGGQAFHAANASAVVPTLREAMGVISADSPPANLPPETLWARPSLETLGPPNHQMVNVDILGVTDPEGSPVAIQITGITQNEPVSGAGGLSPDGAGIGLSTASLRSERNGNGQGRIYRITFIAKDELGAESTGTVKVCVPHDLGENALCQDHGEVFDSTAP